MAAIDTVAGKHQLEESTLPPRKRFKTTELPLNSAQRSSIDGLLHTFKKKGEYDALRKQVWSQFEESEEKIAFTKSLHELAEEEIDRDPSLLSRDRSKAATLMQGAVDRSEIYKDVEKALDVLIAKNIDNIVKAGREIRKAEVGEGVAAEEEKRGNKTDEEYAKDIAVKREERARLRKREEARKRREDEMEALKAEEAKKLEELNQLRSADERRKERDARRAEREAEMERRKRPNKLENIHEKDKMKVEDPASKPPTPAAPVIDDEAITAQALEDLLRESREMVAKSAVPKAEPEDSASPHRPIPKGPAADRNKALVKPRLSYSSAPIHQGSPIPPRPREHSRSRSPYRATSSRYDRSRSASRTGRRSHSVRDEQPRREVESEAKAAYKAQMQSKRDTEPDFYKKRSYRDDEEHRSRSRSRSRGTDRESTRDRDRSKHRDYDYDYDRRRSHYDERPRSRDRERSRYEDRPYTRPRREEAPEHIDRYVPGGAAPRRDRERRESKEDDATTKDSTRDRDRDSSYYDVDRDRRYYKKDHDSGRSDYRDKDRDRDRDRDSRYRDRDRYEERSYARPRREDPPEGIDRYVPGGTNKDRDRDRERDRDRSR
ncbi:hypothetical protein P7C71_g4989, partial [Lecanoromycetidae sp. Uapishka_2]